MHTLAKLTCALVAAATCAVAGAQMSDAERRAQNREEALAQRNSTVRGTVREDAHVVASKAREGGHVVASKARRGGHVVASKTRAGARATKRFTHRQAEKLRRFGARTNARFPASDPNAPTPGNTQPVQR